MRIKIVTDSTSDLPEQVARELDITIVPAYLRFGTETYRDRIDISEDDFYERLLREPIHPATEPPTPQDFTAIYRRLSEEADAIISIHISSKLSATYNSAIRGKEIAEVNCPIEIVDSQLVTMGLGLLVVAASSAVRLGKNLHEVIEEVRATIPRIHMLGLFDTLKYLARGGRISKAKALLASALNVKQMLTMKDGEIEPAGQVRSWASGIDGLVDFVNNIASIDNLAIVYSTTLDEAQSLAKRMLSITSKERIILARLGPVLGVHGGPNALFVAFRDIVDVHKVIVQP